MSELVKRDFKVKYKRSVLGILWSLLYPVLMMSVMAVVFSQMFRFNMEGVNFLVYLLTGIVMFNFFGEATNTATTSVISNFSLINKVYIPKYIFPLSKCLFIAVNFLLTLIPLIVIIAVTGDPDAGTKVYLDLSWLALPLVFIAMFIFIVGVSLLVATVSVFLRDVIYIWGIIVLITQYLTPIFYPVTILPETIRQLLIFNPMYVYVACARNIILDGHLPSLQLIGLAVAYAFGALIIGALIFKKKQDKFIHYA
jgi:ABC-type polysaccharide/polyol phosphate export permease